MDFHCPQEGCGCSYTRKYNLQRHLKDKHGIEDCATAGRFICHIEMCRKAFFHASKLIDHYKEHDMQMCKQKKLN